MKKVLAVVFSMLISTSFAFGNKSPVKTIKSGSMYDCKLVELHNVYENTSVDVSSIGSTSLFQVDTKTIVKDRDPKLFRTSRSSGITIFGNVKSENIRVIEKDKENITIKYTDRSYDKIVYTYKNCKVVGTFKPKSDMSTANTSGRADILDDGGYYVCKSAKMHYRKKPFEFYNANAIAKNTSFYKFGDRVTLKYKNTETALNLPKKNPTNTTVYKNENISLFVFGDKGISFIKKDTRETKEYIFNDCKDINKHIPKRK